METKIWTSNDIQALLLRSDKMVIRSLEKLFELQTNIEQKNNNSIEPNRIGFNSFDAPILSSIAKFYLNEGYLSPKQIVIVRKKLLKYKKQLTKIANRGL